MPQITLDLSDATELAETLAFITGWLSGSQEQILTESLAKRRNLHLQIILSDDDAGPDTAEEIAFGHQRAVGFEQRQK